MYQRLVKPDRISISRLHSQSSSNLDPEQAGPAKKAKTSANEFDKSLGKGTGTLLPGSVPRIFKFVPVTFPSEPCVPLRPREPIYLPTCSEHFRNVDVLKKDTLQRMNKIIFLDVDNQLSFFKKLGQSLPDKIFVWGFMGERTAWHVPTYMHNFREMTKKGQWFLNETSGPTKDSADYTITMTIGYLADQLPPGIAFTIVSADKGFCEIQRLMSNDTRDVTVVNPSLMTNAELYTVLAESRELSKSVPRPSVNYEVPDYENPQAQRAVLRPPEQYGGKQIFKLVPVIYDRTNPTAERVVLRPPGPTSQPSWEAATPHFQNIDIHYLRRMKNMLFLNVNNRKGFFQRLDGCLPDTTYAWGFISSKDHWKAQTHLINFQEMKEKCQFKKVECGETKDSAHFAIVLTIAHLANKLPREIAFTIISDDESFLEVERLMKNDPREVTVINPDFMTNIMLYTSLTMFKSA